MEAVAVPGAGEVAGAGEMVLIVDDEPDIVSLLVSTLQPEGFRLLSAYDGESALRIARAERPVLILLGWILPGRNRLEVCRALCAEVDPQLHDVPVVLLTARTEHRGRLRGRRHGLSAGAVRPAHVGTRMRGWLLRARGQAGGA